ncbi:hypothetical protein SOVF_120050 [Spinacia oleracea]|nr:hypothetical protein SOVF_120050 [Spinacia oleracea]
MPPKERTTWDPKATETFLDLCLESKSSGSSKYDWESIKQRLNAKIK